MERNMNPKRCPMPVQDASVRKSNFKEVSEGYSFEMAVEEARRCLNCKNKPCTSMCPVRIDIPEFIERVANEDMEGAYEIISRSSALPAVCGRVCPQETQCESVCVRGIKGESVAIGRLERFVADYHREHSGNETEKIESNSHKVAIIGSGPSGLSAAGDLARLGYEVTVFEALHTAGGVLVYGIPEFRLPKDIVNSEIEKLKKMGVNIMTNMVIGKIITVDELFENGFEAVYIASGAGLPRFMNIKGEALKGVYSANEYLTRINLMKAYLPNSKTPIKKGKKVCVVGGGNVAMDAARSALRLGADEVYIVYRRSMDELPARKEEVEHAIEEGIIFKTLTNPVEILGDDNGDVCAMRCISMELGEVDESGRRKACEIEGSEFVLEADTVIMSIGTSPNPLIRKTTPGLETNKRGCIVTDGEFGQTSREGVYAGGDAVTGAATVILAMGAGKKAAKAIDDYIKKQNN
ncbi:MAG: NADPH-dependent glutamate synthase [Clostridia bacterium]|nr:NADPH-dependent glutamate synthase [Clostridia bacterium]